MIDLRKFARRSKMDDIPGTVLTILDEKCPLCGRIMRKYKPCCGNPHGYTGCPCGYKIAGEAHDAH